MSEIALSASASENSERAEATYASIAWVSASMPVCAVRVCGIVSGMSVSRTAMSGVTSKSASGYLMPVE